MKIDSFVLLVRQRTDLNAMREHGFELCECGEWTDHKDSNDEPACEECCSEGDAEMESELLYLNRGRL